MFLDVIFEKAFSNFDGIFLWKNNAQISNIFKAFQSFFQSHETLGNSKMTKVVFGKLISYFLFLCFV